MYYEKKDLRENIAKHILNLGVDERFLDNPQFSDILSRILPTEIYDDTKEFFIESFEESYEGKGITIRPRNIGDELHQEHWTISCPQKDTIKFSSYRKNKYIQGQRYIESFSNEEVAQLSTNGYINVDKYSVYANNIDCKENQRVLISFYQKETYNPNGIMIQCETRNFETIKQNISMEEKQETLSTLKFNVRSSNPRIQVTEKSLMRREGLDIAKLTRRRVNEYGFDETVYSGTVQLKSEHGVRKMEYAPGVSYEPQVEILPKRQEEIEELISKETNPKVKEELRKLAQGREKFYYNSKDDPNFICIEYEGQHRQR